MTSLLRLNCVKENSSIDADTDFKIRITKSIRMSLISLSLNYHPHRLQIRLHFPSINNRQSTEFNWLLFDRIHPLDPGQSGWMRSLISLFLNSSSALSTNKIAFSRALVIANPRNSTDKSLIVRSHSSVGSGSIRMKPNPG